MEYVMRSYIGNRTEQQDRAEAVYDDKGLFAVLCDGMGGRKNGADVSRAAVDELCFRYLHCYSEDFISFMTKGAADLDKKIHDAFGGKGGTTLVTAFVDKNDNSVEWFSLGDSRLYLFRDRKVTQLTEDHNYFSILDRQLSEGEITEQYYRQEALRGHALTSFLGVNGLEMICKSPEPFALQKGDVLILTSDGLFKSIPMQDVCEYLLFDDDISQTADRLIERVKKISDISVDNTTFIIIKIGE